MEAKSFQSYYPDLFSRCYGCGTQNEQGLHIESFWDGDESVCQFRPRPYHTAMPGFVYGGLIASLIDCHSTGTAAAAAYRAQGRPLGSAPELRYVTASLQVDYLRPTPIDCVLEVRGRVEEIKGRKVIVRSTLTARGEICAQGRVVAVQVPDTFLLPTKAAEECR